MRKKTVIGFFGTQKATADALGITEQAVSQWPDLIPEGSAYKAESVSKGKLRVDARMYRKSQSHSKRANPALSA